MHMSIIAGMVVVSLVLLLIAVKRAGKNDIRKYKMGFLFSFIPFISLIVSLVVDMGGQISCIF